MRSPSTTTPEPRGRDARTTVDPDASTTSGHDAKGDTMTAAVSPPGELEPIETASTDELRALQLERLRWSLRHAYDNVPYYRTMFDVAAVHPDDLKDLADLAKFPFTTKASRCPGSRSPGCTPRPVPPAAPPSSATPPLTSTPGPPSWPGPSAPPAAAPGTSCTSPTGTACSPAGSAPTTVPSGSAAPWSPSLAA